jgi:16S rRNA (uracil1498-N3)-methyltransferase
MSLPYFFSENISAAGLELTLDEESSKHIVQVLRMDEGEKLLLTDGAGTKAVAEIIKAHKKNCTVNIISKEFKDRELPALTIAISLIKNTSRFEWFLEKATELGTAEIIPMVCERTEKQHSRHDRFLNIVKSAMLQSSQSWIPCLHEPVKFSEVVAKANQEKKYIGHLLEDDKRMLSEEFNASINSHIILIGPEGDFTPAEIKSARDKQFIPVSMGKTTLRVETAGLYAAVVCR